MKNVPIGRNYSSQICSHFNDADCRRTSILAKPWPFAIHHSLTSSTVLSQFALKWLAAVASHGIMLLFGSRKNIPCQTWPAVFSPILIFSFWCQLQRCTECAAAIAQPQIKYGDLKGQAFELIVHHDFKVKTVLD